MKKSQEWVPIGDQKVRTWAHVSCPGSSVKVVNPYAAIDDIVLYCSVCNKKTDIKELRDIDENRR